MSFGKRKRNHLEISKPLHTSDQSLMHTTEDPNIMLTKFDGP